MNTIFILATQYDNLGDLIINKELINALSQHGHVDVDISRAPEEFTIELFSSLNENVSPLQYGIRSYMFYWKLFTKQYNCNVLILPPGAQSLIVNKNNLPSFILQILSIFILKLFKVKIGCFGISFDAKKSNLMGLLKWRLFDHIGVRSQEAIPILKTSLKNISYCPDLAILMKNKIRSHFNHDWGKYAVVSARSDIPGYKDDRYAAELIKTCETVLLLMDEIETVVLIHQVGRDREFMVQIKNALCLDNKNIIFLPDKLNEDQVSEIYASAKYVLSNRLHVLLLAIINGTPLVTLIHQEHLKLKEVLTDLSLENTFLDISSSPEEIHKKLTNIIKKTPKIIEEFNIKKSTLETQIQNDIKSFLS